MPADDALRLTRKTKNMRKNFLLPTLLLFLLAVQPSSAQYSLVNPVPQQIVREGDVPLLIDIPESWNIRADASRLHSFAVEALRKGCPNVKESAKAKFTVTLGVKGDKAVKKYVGNLPDKREGYWMTAADGSIVIVGADEAGLFYGVQTLIGSMGQGKIEKGVILDWPDVPFRGTVEGFYGTPWSHEARMSQIDFYGRNKMNVYIYGPKDDPYHRSEWRKPYPEAEGKRIQELNEHAKNNGVNFYWAIHPGVDIKWNNADRDNLINKLEKMYALGIRSFAVFFDDIWGEGAKAEKQAELLNYVDENFIHKHTDVAPLIMCPTIYNRAWSRDDNAYLRPLGSQLNKDVNIMWTGNSVVHCIDRESMEWVNQRIERKAYIWWNFPVSDYVRDHILLGPAYGNGLNIADEMSGFVSNPMEHAEASKLSLYGIADYVWNMADYDAQRDWEKAFSAVLPSHPQELRTFALYNKDLGKNGHGFQREEGDELKPAAEAALRGEVGAIKELRQKSVDLNRAADILLGDDTNPGLLREIHSWLLQAKNLANYGVTVCDLALAIQTADEKADGASFKQLYEQAFSIQRQMYDLENSPVRHPTQTGIKVGTKMLLPTLNKLFTLAVNKYNAKHATELTNSAEYQPYILTSDVEQLRLLPITMQSDEVYVTPSNEVINWQKDGQLLIEADRELKLNWLEFNLNVKDVAKNFKLELYAGGQWTPITLYHNRPDDPVIHTDKDLPGKKASKIRLTNVSGEELKVYFYSFKFSRE